jgi:transposase InsO family protein
LRSLTKTRYFDFSTELLDSNRQRNSIWHRRRAGSKSSQGSTNNPRGEHRSAFLNSIDASNSALARGRPEIFNTDQGSQFTAQEHTGRLEEAGSRVSRDGREPALDNAFVERLWRSIKYEDIYLKDFERVPELESGLTAYF